MKPNKCCEVPLQGFKAPFEAFEGFEKENEGGFEASKERKASKPEAEGASLTLRRL